MIARVKHLLITLLSMACGGQLLALDLKLVDGSIVTCERVTLTVGTVSMAPGFNLWIDSKTSVGRSFDDFSDEALQILTAQPDLNRVITSVQQARATNKFQPAKNPLIRDVAGALQEGLIDVTVTGDGTTELTLRATRTSKAAEIPLVIHVVHPLVIQSQNAEDSLLFLSIFGNPRNVTLPAVSPAQKSNPRPASLGTLTAAQLNKAMIRQGTAFQILEADPVVAWLDSAGRNFSGGGTSAILQHLNPGATWEQIASAQATPQARFRGIGNLRPEDWEKGKQLLVYAKERAARLQKSLGSGRSAAVGNWVPVTLDEFTAALTDLQGEADAFLTLASYSTGDTAASLAARKQTAQRNIANLKTRAELAQKNLPGNGQLQIFPDGHYWFVRTGFQVPEKVEGDPFGDRRVVTLGRSSWDGYRFQNQSGTTEGRIGAGSVSGDGILMLSLGGGYFYGWKRAGAEVVSANPAAIIATPPSPSAPSPANPPPQMRRELSLDQAWQDGLISGRMLTPAGPLELTRTATAGLGPLVIQVRRGLAVTQNGATDPAFFIKPGEGVAVPPSAPATLDTTRLVIVTNLSAGAKVGKITEAGRFHQYVLANDKVSHDAARAALATGENSPLLQRLRADFDVIDKLTGGNPEAWIVGNWSSAPQAVAGQAYVALEEQRIEAELLSQPNVPADQAVQIRSLFQQTARSAWTMKYGVAQPPATATFSADGTVTIKSSRGLPDGLHWWWDGRCVRLDRYTRPEQTLGLAPNGVLSSGELFLHLQKTATR